MTSQTKEKSDPQLTEEPSTEERLPACKKSSKRQLFKVILSIRGLYRSSASIVL